MLNRRHLRIKILQAMYAFEQSDDRSIARAEKELFHSIHKMYEMYLYLMLIMVEIRAVAEQKTEEGKNKKLPSEQDLNPNMKLVNNRFLKQLEGNRSLLALAEKAKVNWIGEQALIRKLYKLLLDSDAYLAYMESDSDDYVSDKEAVVKMFKKVIVNLEPLQYFFEEKSIFWVDDLDLVASMVIKTLKSFNEDVDAFHPMLPLWKDAGDEQAFVQVLFRKTITQTEEHQVLLKKYTDNWDVDRIALIDMILMRLALTEGREFNQIPIKVTLNEYIEISKFYSTPKSSNFINGVLDKLFTEMKEDGRIKKVGRGLIN